MSKATSAPAKTNSKDEELGRLVDMDTREVSLVDAAANKRTYLLVKRDGEADSVTKNSATAVAEKPPVETAKAPESKPVEKAADVKPAGTAVVLAKRSEVSYKVCDTLDRVQGLRMIIEVAPLSETATPLPRSVAVELRMIQFALQACAEQAKSEKYVRTPYIPNDVGSASLTPMSLDVKQKTLAALKPIEADLKALDAELAKTPPLTPEQVTTITGASTALTELLSEIPTETVKAAEVRVYKTSVPAEKRLALQTALTKTIQALRGLHEGLEAEPTEKADDVATEFDVGSRLHDATALIESVTVVAREKSMTSELDGMVGDLRAVQLDVEKNSNEAALGRLRGLMKALVHLDERLDTKKKEAPMSANATATPPAPAPAAATTQTPAVTGKADATPPGAVVTPPVPTAKVGRPMQGDRLKRLKSAVTLLKEALGDLRSGTVSLEKFKNSAGLLAAIIGELDIAKRAAERRGVSDTRSAALGEANVGSGVQPDASVTKGEVFGEGSPPALNEIMKRVDGLAESNTKLAKSLEIRDKTIATLETEVQTLKRTRVAPSSSEEGDEEVQTNKRGGASDDKVTWPLDMSADDEDDGR